MNNVYDYNLRTILAGPYTRMYFSVFDRSALFFFNGIYFGSNAYDNMLSSSVFEFDLGLGLSLFLNKHVLFDVQGGYSYYTERVRFSAGSYNDKLNIWSVSFGLSFLIEPKKFNK